MPKSGSNDSGVSGRMEGAFLTAMNDIPERIFWVFTANNVKKMHEAFLRAERVDGVFYVHLPDSRQRANLWKLYGKKFFPKEVMLNGKPSRFPQHLSIDFATVLSELKAAPKKDIDIAAWADRFTLPLLCLPNTERKAALASLKAVNLEVRAAVVLVKDTGWSPAEIRACCRLARLQKKSLAVTQKQIRPVSVSAKAVVDSLEEWASESALDAETGEVYTRLDDPEEVEENEALQAEASVKVRRKVRAMKDDTAD